MHWSRYGYVVGLAIVMLLGSVSAGAQEREFEPVTDAMLQTPPPEDWLMWRRTLDSWGYSPLDQITRDNVGDLRMVWSRALTPGRQQGTTLVYDGMMYMPNPSDVIQAIDAVTGDLVWEHRREVPEDIEEYVFNNLWQNNRNIAIYGHFIIDTSVDDHLFALDAVTGRLAWETKVVDYREHPPMQSSGPIIANGRAISGRNMCSWSCTNIAVARILTCAFLMSSTLEANQISVSEMWRRFAVSSSWRASSHSLCPTFLKEACTSDSWNR